LRPREFVTRLEATEIMRMRPGIRLHWRPDGKVNYADPSQDLVEVLEG
jgi:hypothetical protein